jgi:hypothetical protein
MQIKKLFQAIRLIFAYQNMFKINAVYINAAYNLWQLSIYICIDEPLLKMTKVELYVKSDDLLTWDLLS